MVDYARDANSGEITVEASRFRQRLLFAREIDLVPEEASDFLERVGNKMSRESVGMVAISEVVGESLKIIHVFGEIFGDVRFQDLEHAALAPAGFGIAPGEANDGADAGFFENRGRDFDGTGFDLGTQRFLHDSADVFGLNVANAVL